MARSRDKPAGLLACYLHAMPRSLRATLENAKTAAAPPRSKGPKSVAVDQSRLTVETIGPLGRRSEVVCQIKAHNLALRRQGPYVRIVSGAPESLLVCTENLIRVDDVTEPPKLAE